MRRLPALAMTCALSLSVTAAPAAAASTTLVDCGSGAKLQAAIDAAGPGDTLQIQGTCFGHFVIDHDLTLEGTGDDPTLDGGGSGTVLTVPPGPGGPPNGQPPQPTGATVLITGLTIKRGDKGILDRGTMTLTRSTVRDNDLGIDIDLDLGIGGGLTLDHSRVRDNTGRRDLQRELLAAGQDSVVADNGGDGIENWPAEGHHGPALHHPGQRRRRHPQLRCPVRR